MPDLRTPALRFTLILFLVTRLVSAAFMLGTGGVMSYMGLQPGFGAKPLAGEPVNGWLAGNFFGPWHRWDTNHYITMALVGYDRPDHAAWPPLYPVLIRFFNLLFDPLSAALLVSNLAALVFYYWLYRLIKDDFSETDARLTLVFLSVFPTAFFLTAAYSESLFMALITGSLLAARKRRFWLAAILAAVSALARILGVLMVLPIGWEIWMALREKNSTDATGWKAKPLLWFRAALPLVVIPLPYLGFAAWLHWGAQFPWPWQAITTGWDLVYAAPWAGVIGNVNDLILAGQGAAVAVGTTLMDLGAVIFAVALLIIGARRIPVSYTLFGAAMLVVSLSKVSSNGLLVSTTRYVLVLFPVFLAQALTWKNRWIRRFWLVFAVTLQILLLYVFWMGHWVG